MAENKEMLKNNPIFTLAVESANCGYFVNVNGFQVYDSASWKHSKSEVPINQSLKPGENDIEVELVFEDEKKFDANADITVTLYVKESGQPKVTKQAVMTLKYNEKLARTIKNGTSGTTEKGRYSSKDRFYQDKNGDVKVSETKFGDVKFETKVTGMSITKTIDLPINLPRWKFFDSEYLIDPNVISTEDVELKLLNEMLPFYQKIHSLFQQKRVDELVKLFEERSTEGDLAFYRQPGTTREELKAAIIDAVNDPNKKLKDLKKEDIWVYVENNRKIARLGFSRTNSAISFKITDVSEMDLIEGYDLLLRREKGQWIITR